MEIYWAILSYRYSCLWNKEESTLLQHQVGGILCDNMVSVLHICICIYIYIKMLFVNNLIIGNRRELSPVSLSSITRRLAQTASHSLVWPRHAWLGTLSITSLFIVMILVWTNGFLLRTSLTSEIQQTCPARLPRIRTSEHIGIALILFDLISQLSPDWNPFNISEVLFFIIL